MTAASSITTAEQLLTAGDIGRCELVRGELIMMSPSSFRHGGIAARLAQLLWNYVDDSDLGLVVGAETGFKIAQNPDTVRAPDVGFVRADRLHLAPERGFFPGHPDLAVEVLSPDDTASEVLEKVGDWLNSGTEAVWIVDPKRKTVEIHRADRPVLTLQEDDQLADDDVLIGLRLKVANVFP